MTIEDFVSRLKKVAKAPNGFTACCPSHEDSSPSLSVARGEKGIILTCHAGCKVQDIVAAVGLKVSDLFYESPKKTAPPIVRIQQKIVETYVYQDALGKDLFRVQRLEPGRDGKKKSFCQQRSDGKGNFVSGMDGVARVLYNFPAVLRAEQVVICEGERKADYINALGGYVATCNVGGAGKWMDAWTDALKGKHVVICPDSDEPGQNHARLLHQALSGHVKDILHIKIPKPHNDVVDLFRSVGDDKGKRLSVWMDLLMSAANVPQNLDIPIYSMAQLEEQYKEFTGKSKDTVLRLGSWLPSYRELRGVVPGELMMILADTGAGKSAALQNIALYASPLPVLLFEMELPGTLCFERFAAMACNCGGDTVESLYGSGRDVAWVKHEQLKRVYTCAESNLTLDRIRDLIHKSQLVMGVRPAIVMLDYIQLIQGRGDRYEKTSDAAEQLKVLAKEENVILITASQVQRAGGDSGKEITLHRGKDSGAIENSSGVVLGMWRDGDDIVVRLLKFTKGRASNFKDIKCGMDCSLLIKERMGFAESDI